MHNAKIHKVPVPGEKTFHIVLLCRPPDPQIFDKFGKIISDLVTHCDDILLMGDFNINLNMPVIL